MIQGEAENMVLKYAAESNGVVEVTCAKPGLIMSPNFVGRTAMSAVSNAVNLPAVKVEECAAASLKQCIEGIEKDPLLNKDLVSIGSEYLKKLP